MADGHTRDLVAEHIAELTPEDTPQSAMNKAAALVDREAAHTYSVEPHVPGHPETLWYVERDGERVRESLTLSEATLTQQRLMRGESADA